MSEIHSLLWINSSQKSIMSKILGNLVISIVNSIVYTVDTIAEKRQFVYSEKVLASKMTNVIGKMATQTRKTRANTRPLGAFPQVKPYDSKHFRMNRKYSNFLLFGSAIFVSRCANGGNQFSGLFLGCSKG